MTNDSKQDETKAAMAAISKATRDAADNMARAALAFTRAIAAYDRRLKREGRWPVTPEGQLDVTPVERQGVEW